MTTANAAILDALSFNPSGAHYDGTDISSATTLTPPGEATKLLIQTLTQNIRITLDGTAPTSTKGFQLVAGDPPTLIVIGEDTVIKIIEEAATADVQYQWGTNQ